MSTMNITHPELSKEWHPKKNGNLTPALVTPGSGRKAWWVCLKTCPQGCPHEYQSTIANRCRNNSGCPYCAHNQKNTCIHTSIQTTHPEIAKEWHPTKNDTLKADSVTSRSGLEAWWLCPNTCLEDCKHEYKTLIYNRLKNGSNCPYCSGRICCIHKSIVTTHPEIASEWHPTKNGNLDPITIMSGSSREKIWWLCANTCPYGCLHEFQMPASDRCSTKQSGCPFCSNPPKQICKHSSILYTNPDILKQLHPTKNGDITADKIMKGSNKKVWWLCEKTCIHGCKHEWKAVVSSRTRKDPTGCPYCSSQMRSYCEHMTIQYTHPLIAKQWHPIKNGKLTPLQFISGHETKVWWICDSNPKHEWESNIYSRCIMKTNCPYCVNKTEKKLYEYLLEKYPTTIAQFKLDTCKSKQHLPFDFCIPEIKTIIELDGAQHFRQISNWQCPQEAIQRDIYKMDKAHIAGYKVIRLFQEDVYNNDKAWLDTHLLPEITSTSRSSIFISTIDSLYDEHLRSLKDNTRFEHIHQQTKN